MYRYAWTTIKYLVYNSEEGVVRTTNQSFPNSRKATTDIKYFTTASTAMRTRIPRLSNSRSKNLSISSINRDSVSSSHHPEGILAGLNQNASILLGLTSTCLYFFQAILRPLIHTYPPASSPSLNRATLKSLTLHAVLPETVHRFRAEIMQYSNCSRSSRYLPGMGC